MDQSKSSTDSNMGSISHRLAQNSARDYRKDLKKTYTTKPNLAQTPAKGYKKEFENKDLAITKPSQAEKPLKLSTNSEKCLHQNTNEF